MVVAPTVPVGTGKPDLRSRRELTGFVKKPGHRVRLKKGLRPRPATETTRHMLFSFQGSPDRGGRNSPIPSRKRPSRCVAREGRQHRAMKRRTRRRNPRVGGRFEGSRAKIAGLPLGQPVRGSITMPARGSSARGQLGPQMGPFMRCERANLRNSASSRDPDAEKTAAGPQDPAVEGGGVDVDLHERIPVEGHPTLRQEAARVAA